MFNFMPHYRKHGKLMIPLTRKQFIRGMKGGKFVEDKHAGFITLLYYSGVRKQEALRSLRKQFSFGEEELFFDVGVRLKHGKQTPPINIPLTAAFVDELVMCVEITKSANRVWPYSKKTGYNIVSRVFPYPHYLRLSRITNFFLEGYNIAQVRSWTGLTLKSLEAYVGYADVRKMGRSLKGR